MTSVALLIAPEMVELNKQLSSKSVVDLIDESLEEDKDRVINPVSKFAPV